MRQLVKGLRLLSSILSSSNEVCVLEAAPSKCVFKHRKEAMASVMSTLKRQQVWDGATQTVECSGDKLQKLPYLNIKAERLNGMEWLHVHVHT